MKTSCQPVEKEAVSVSKKNDLLRANIPAIAKPNLLLLTRGIYTKFTNSEVADILQKVKSFTDFTPDNDPWKEHDFGSFIYKGETIFWKIDDYTSVAKEYNKEGYALVLTVLLADEY